MALQQTAMAQHSEPYEAFVKLLFVDESTVDQVVPRNADGSGLDPEAADVKNVYGETLVFFFGKFINVREVLGGRWCTGIISHSTDTVEIALHAMPASQPGEFRLNASQLYQMNVKTLVVNSQQGSHYYAYWVLG